MQDMRFNQMTPIRPEREGEEAKPQKKSFGNKIILIILVIAIVISVPFVIKKFNMKNSLGVPAASVEISSSDYYAIFLDNSQVYFGKIVSKSENEIKLVGVYYLQASVNGNIGTDNDQRFTLIKLGQEVHGPTDELNINMDHVVFYEKLSKDSKLVESITNRN